MQILPLVSIVFSLDVWVEESDIWISWDSEFVEMLLGSEIAIAAVLKAIRLDATIEETQNIEEAFMINP